MKDGKITVCMTMIVRNEADYIARCIESWGKHVDYLALVDTGSTDKTKEVVKEVCEQIGLEYKISDFKWIDDFSAARNFSFEQVPEWCDFVGWIDADDIVENAENIPKLCASAPPSVEAIVFHYFYEKHPSGNWINVHNRERLLRRNVSHPWRWTNRVHECIDLGAVPSGGLAISEDVFFYHMRPVGKPCFTRNVRLLKKQVRDEPHNLRPYAYVGHEYYHIQDWANAYKWYKKYIDMGSTWLAEVYQILHRMADCCIQLGRLDEAKALNLKSIGIRPDWADAYLGMMEVECYKQNWPDAVTWAELGAGKAPIDPALAMNPLDYSYNAWLFYEAALYNVGRVREAVQMVDDALKLIPENTMLQEKKRMYELWLLRDSQAKSMLALADSFNDDERLGLLAATPHYLKANLELRDKLVMPHFVRRPVRDTVVFYCGQSVENWAPPKVNEGGTGGSETAVIEIAKRLAQRGYKVNVYNSCGHWEGEHDGVWYWDWRRFHMAEMPLIFISERIPELADAPINGMLKIMHAHDLHYGDFRLTRERGIKWDAVCPVSAWHGRHLQMLYQIPDDKIRPLPNGIDLARFKQKGIERKPHKCVYSSSPDRGLEALLFNIWPQIKKAVPDAELHIFYGWDSYMASAQFAPDSLQAQMLGFRQYMEQKVQREPGVIWRGRVSQDELAKEFLSAGFWLYPSDFLEVSCITAMEAQAAGVAIIASDVGALTETVADRGILIPGFPRNYTYQRQFLGTFFALADDENLRQEIAARGLEYAPNFSWDLIVNDFVEWAESKLKARDIIGVGQ